MTEAELTTKHTGALRKAHPTWVVLKHCDRFTSGIPDVSVSLGLKTAWVEYKLLKKDEKLRYPFTWINDKAQLEQTRRLDGYYLCYDPIGKEHVLMDAATLTVLCAMKQPVLTQSGDGLDRLDTLLTSLLEGTR